MTISFPRTSALAVCLFALLARPALTWGQAVVDESKETVALYVDAVHGSDSNDGSSATPFQTINKGVATAISNNHASIGTQVNIQPGTYRETVNMSPSPLDTALPMTFQAVTPGTVVISGGSVVSGWIAYSSNPNIFTNAWTYNFPACAQINGCPVALDIVQSSNLIAVNNALMTEVLSLTQLKPGSFFVDPTGGTVYLYPPSNTNLSTATVEVATQSELWNIGGKSNIVLRGLTLQYANSCRGNAALSVGGQASNVLLDTLTLQWNNGQGLAVANPASNFTVQNTISKHNGDSGFQENQTLNGLWSNDTASFNNWRGAQGGYYSCNVGGVHAFQAHSDTITGLTVAYNQAYGIHWDTDNANITVSNLVSTNNLVGGAFIEKNEGPISITSSSLCNASPRLGAGGLSLRNSETVSLTNSNVVNNPLYSIGVIGVAGGISITNWQTLQVINTITENFINTGNVLQNNGSTLGLFSDSYLNGSDWTSFVTTLTSNSNTWWNSANSGAGNFVVPTPNLGTATDFAGWQSTTGQDANSIFAAPATDPAAACNAVTPDIPDYWLGMDNPALTLDATGNGTLNLTGTPLSFAGTISLLLDGLQNTSGITTTLNPTSLSVSGGNVAAATLSINAALTAAPGTYPFTLIANSGNVTRMVRAQLTVPPVGLRLTTASLTFAPQQQNTTSSPLSVTATNYGATPVSFSSIAASISVFSVTSGCPASLASGASCTVQVTFTPNSVGILPGTLTFTDSDSTSPQIVNLTGTGTGIPIASFSPNSLSFPNVGVGSSSTTTATFTNTSTNGVSLNIASMSLSGANPQAYSQTNNCPTSLAAGSSCTFTVTFTPTAYAQQNANIVIADNVNSGSNSLTMNGTGGTPSGSYAPSPLAFNSVGLGSSSTLSATFTNSSGNGALFNISSITLGGSNPTVYSQTNGCPATLAVNASCSFTVVFTPNAYASQPATLLIGDPSGGTTTLNLTGTGARPTATVVPATLNFGNVGVGSTATLTSTVTNTATNGATLNITSTTITGANASDFTQTNNCPASIAPNATCTLTVVYKPTVYSSESASLTLADNVSSGSNIVTLNGTGGNPTATLVIAQFGNVGVGTSATLAATLTNTSTNGATLNITSILLAGTNPADFSQTNNCAATLAPNASCVLTVTFKPAQYATETATLTVYDNVASGSNSVTLTGTGAAPTASYNPASVSFPSAGLGVSQTLTTVFTNTSTTGAPLTITSISVGGSNASDFTQTSNCPATLNPNAACTVTVIFTPSATGLRQATLYIYSNVSGGSSTAALSGTGGLPTASLAPGSLTYGSVTVAGSSSLTETVTNTSANGAALLISSISVGGTNPGDFSQTNTCPASLAANATCTVTVKFIPITTGLRQATLYVNSNVSGGITSGSLTGTGVLPSGTFSPISVSYGNIGIGTSSTLTATFTNTSTNTANLNISSVTLTGTNFTEYSQTNTCPATLAPNASCIFTITFSPTGSGTRSATLNVFSNVSAGSNTLSLTGTGGTPTVTFTPTSLAFGKVGLGTSSTKTITMQNTSTNGATLTTTNITFTGTYPTDYSQTNTCPTNLAPNASCVITVTFTPGKSGSRNATLTVYDNASTGSSTAAMTGSGSAPTAKLSPATDSFGNQKTGTTSNAKISTLTNTSTNGAILNVTSITMSGTDTTEFAQTNTCPATLAPNATCTISVTFTPASTGSESATVTVTTDTSTGSNTISLTGTGT